MFETRKRDSAPNEAETDLIEVRRPAAPTTEIRWRRDSSFTIGRLSQNALALSDDLTVSGCHAEIQYVGTIAVIHDLGSTNGTLLNGEPLQVPTRLAPGDRINVGSAELVFNPPSPTAAGPPPRAHDADVFYVRCADALPFVFRWDRGQPLKIGRLAVNTLAFTDDRDVSRRHAEIQYVGDAATIQDVGSANGTFLNGEPVQGPARLAPGDRIGMGNTEMVFQPELATPAAEAWLEVQSGPAQQPVPAEIRLPAARCVFLGRGPHCDVVLPDPAVAERHACIQTYCGDYVFTDLCSSTGTFLNGRRIFGGIRLKPDDVLQLGSMRFRFKCPQAAPPAALAGGEADPSASATLHSLPPFNQLPTELLSALAENCEWITVDAGADLIPDTRRELPAALYILAEGKAHVVGTVGVRHQQAYVVAELRRGDLIGERALITGRPYSRRVVADTPLRALRITRAAYAERWATNPRLRALFEEQLPQLALRRQLERTLLLRCLPADVVDRLLPRLHAVAYAAGDQLAQRGQPNDRFLLLVAGRARVQALRGEREVALGQIGAGECVGEAIAAPDGVYSSTVIAETPVEAYSLSRADFEAATAGHPARTGLLSGSLELTPPNLLLESIAPFNALPPQLVTRIATHMRLKRFYADEVVIEQDDVASAFYIVLSGTVQVSFHTASGEEKVITTLGPGQHFGEAALLTGEGRNARVRALEDCQLWALYKDGFEEALEYGRAYQLDAYFGQDLRMRSRPRRLAEIEIVRQSGGADAGYILHRPSSKSYLRLSEQGMFVWGLLDGDHTINDLCVAYLAKYHNFDLELIASTVAQLQALGFVEVPPVDLHRGAVDQRAPAWRRALTTAFQVLTWRKEFSQADAWFDALYRQGGRVLFAPLALALLGLLAVAGLAAFGYLLLVELRGSPPGREMMQGAALAIVLLGFLLITALHEVGHGLTCKHYGRRVNGAGLGIAYLFPYAFVGTTDIWMAGKGARMAVSAAGPFVNLLTGAVCALAALAVSDVTIRAALFSLAGISYLLVISNLHPFMELDGYYILVDWLEMPSLRKRALRFLRRDLWRCLRARRFDREERILAAFGAAVLLFTVPMGLGLVVFFHDLFVNHLSALLSVGGSELLGWACGALVLLAFLIPFAFELELISPQPLTLHGRTQ